MFDSNSNPDAPVSGNWLANTYAPQQVSAPVYHTVGYSINPYGSSNDLSRRNMMNNPAYAVQMPTVPAQQVQPFSTYPPSAVPTPSLNQFVQNNQNSGNTAAMSQNNPWANLNPMAAAPVTPVIQQPIGNAWGYQMPAVTPTVNTTDLINQTCSWDKKAGSWDLQLQQNLQAPLINWNQYNSQPAQSGCYAPNAPAVQPEYPRSFVTTPVNASWSAICDTNFKTQF